ncbi:Hypothetical predicted protein [Prunus dulcis]|uniref:Uncharacterized protein n=1 Tax=Prunus dulcis TaxID=3755 RepID=A0A5E4G407_PRUDU|nr:hypothetical protein L3X38_012419 [Prunus dulcis]VVA34535.1 Hypothetical predicted protein [Prunus dulcis]
MSTPLPQNVAWAVNVAAGSLGIRGHPNTQVSISRTYLCDSAPSEKRRMLDATPSRTAVVSYGHHWFTGIKWIKMYPQNSSSAQEEKNARPNAFEDCRRELCPPMVYWDKEVPLKLILRPRRRHARPPHLRREAKPKDAKKMLEKRRSQECSCKVLCA